MNTVRRFATGAAGYRCECVATIELRESHDGSRYASELPLSPERRELAWCVLELGACGAC